MRLSVIDTKPAADAGEPAPLSAAREAVARAIAWRAEATAAVEEAGRAQQAAERLVAAPDQAKARIAAMRAANAGIVERWAAAGAVGEPELTGTPEEVEGLERELAEAERLSAAARAALPGLVQRIAHAQAGATAGLAAVREAVVGVLFEEAQLLPDWIKTLERQAATLRAEFQASINVLDRHGRAHRAGGSEAQRLRLQTPAPITFTDIALQGAMTRWATLADALVTDERATLEAPR